MTNNKGRSKSSTVTWFDRARQHADRIALIDAHGTWTYAQLDDAATRVASALLGPEADLQERRIAFLVAPGFEYAAIQWGIWRAGGVAVPLGLMHPPPELAYALDDAQVSSVLADPASVDKIRSAGNERSLPILLTTDALDSPLLDTPPIELSRRAMMLYTSGTTGKPKAVVTTHANIQAQVESLVEAWAWSRQDHILHVLPLHHIHGIINVLGCALWIGATCEFLWPFDAKQVWQRFGHSDLTLFMAVPTIYAKLITAWENSSPEERQAMSRGCRQMRLMVSGSAALPASTLERWKSISGHVLLERYGMTEIGMALSNPLEGRRAPGHVGAALPGVEVQRLDEHGQAPEPQTPAEIEVRGPGVFLEYWNRPRETQEAFRNGWFRTGDVAVVENRTYRLLGRTSVDIIKTGGYKVSALEIEEVLREHADISECAVVGVADTQWGQCVSACLVLVPQATLTLNALRDWARQRLAPYKVPTRLLAVRQLPRNTMGKVHKPTVIRLFNTDPNQATTT